MNFQIVCQSHSRQYVHSSCSSMPKHFPAAVSEAKKLRMIAKTQVIFILVALVEEYSPSPTIRLTDEDTLQLYIGVQWKVHVISSFEHLSFKTIFNFFHQKEVESPPKDGFHILCCSLHSNSKVHQCFVYYHLLFKKLCESKSSLISCLNRICRWPRRPIKL